MTTMPAAFEIAASRCGCIEPGGRRFKTRRPFSFT
jgi:hypothetical protein